MLVARGGRWAPRPGTWRWMWRSSAGSRDRLLSLVHRRAPTGPAADTRRPRWGKKRVEVARDAAGDPRRGAPGRRRGPRTGTNGCTSRSSAPRAADVAAWAEEHPSRE